jgi:hypothetical protein
VSLGPLEVSGDLTILGHGTAVSAITAAASQIVVIDAGGDAIIQDIRVYGATVATTGCGGGIYNQGTLALKNARVDSNSMSGHGGGSATPAMQTWTVSRSTPTTPTAKRAVASTTPAR